MSHGQQLSLGGYRVNIDIIEKFAAAGLLTAFSIRFVPPIFEHGSWLNAVVLASEAMVVLFILIRRPTDAISRKWSDWLVGFGGTSAALCAISADGPPLVPTILCGLLMITGLAVSIAAKLTLRRSFGLVAANRGVIVSGPYRLVRHPMYAGYLMIHVGYLLSGPNVWNVFIYTLTTSFQIVRILAEERVLKSDPLYQQLCQKVRYRLIPLVF